MSIKDSTENHIEDGESFRRRALSRKQNKAFISVVALIAFTVSQLIIGYLIYPDIAKAVPATIANSSAVFTIAFIGVQIVTIRMANITAYRVTGQVLPIWLLSVLFGMGVLLLLRLDYGFWFSVLALVSGTVILGLYSGFITKRNRYVLGVPHDMPSSYFNSSANQKAVIRLDSPQLPDEAIDVVVIDDSHLQDHNWTQFLSWCAINSVPVMTARDYIERETGEVDLDYFALGDAMRMSTSRNYLILKRATEMLFCSALLIGLSPLMLVVAVLIRLESRGAAIFTQQRVGRGGRVFTMYKFRSMRAAADVDGAQFASKADPRITRLGSVIRKMRIDELPQLYNVIIGDMSLIGPRPEQVKLVDELAVDIPLFPLRHAVRPGITGWAQVCYGYADDVSSSRTKLGLDLFYIRNVSFLLDVNITIRTIRIIFSGFGAR